MLFADFGEEHEDARGVAGQISAAPLGHAAAAAQFGISMRANGLTPGLPAGSRYAPVSTVTTPRSPSATQPMVQPPRPATRLPAPRFRPRPPAPRVRPEVVPSVRSRRVVRPVMPPAPAPKCPLGQRYDQIEQQCVPVGQTPPFMPAPPQARAVERPVQPEATVRYQPPKPSADSVWRPGRWVTREGQTKWQRGRWVPRQVQDPCAPGYVGRQPCRRFDVPTLPQPVPGEVVAPTTPAPVPEAAITVPTTPPQAPEAATVVPSTPAAAAITAQPVAEQLIKKGVSPLTARAAAPGVVPAVAPAAEPAPEPESILDKKLVGPVKVKHALIGTAGAAALVAALALLR